MKMAHFILCIKTIISEGTTNLLFDHVFQYHGFLKDINYIRGPQFTSKFWK